MCLAVFACHAHPRFPLVVATNRDEFYARPTRPAAWWAEPSAAHDPVWAGRDLEGGGTWMGISRAGRFALLTNVREPGHQAAAAVTRGALVAGFMEGIASSEAYLRERANERHRYNGFNLVCGSVADDVSLAALHHSWSGIAPGGGVEPLGNGLHTLSNAALGTPWPKTTGLRDAARLALRQHAAAGPLTAALFAALADHTEAPDHLLPHTGVGPDWERRLSARFIGGPEARAAGYGTRASTVLLVGADGRVWVEERTFGPGGAPAGRERASWVLGR